MKNPKISVIIPVYNVEKYLEKCIDSVINQTYNNLEIILINDGSTDNSPEICDLFAKKDTRIKVIHSENFGPSNARNLGLDIATGDYIAFVDSDDWIKAEAYEKMLDMMLKTKSQIVRCTSVKTDGETIFEKNFGYCYPTATTCDSKVILKAVLLDKISSHPCFSLYLNKCWEDVRFPVGQIYEDIAITFKAFSKASRISFISEDYYNYRTNPNSITRKVNPLKPYHIFLSFKEHYIYAKKHYTEIVDKCCTLTSKYAISTYFHYCTDAKSPLKPYINDVCDFLKQNKKEIVFTSLPKTRKLALKIFYFSPLLFKLLCKIFYITGLQKALHFDIK